MVLSDKAGLADLTQQSTLKQLITDVITNTVPLLSDETVPANVTAALAAVESVATVIANGNVAIKDIVASIQSDAEKLLQIAQVQYVVQKPLAEDIKELGGDLKELGDGTLNADTLEQNANTLVQSYTGNNLDLQIQQAADKVNNPTEQANISDNLAPVLEIDNFNAINDRTLTINVLCADS